jgi:energy-coupling factor transport system ATP-binding protein
MVKNQSISLKNLSVKYPGSPAPQLKQITAQADPGQIIGIVGNSRAGKTTLCQILSGVIPTIISAKVSGTYTLNGHSPVADWPAYNQLTGVVLQNPAGQLSGLADTVADEIAFDLINQGIQEAVITKRVNQAAMQMGLTAQLTQHPESLSGGQLQRLAIASAIATDPQILILDDPTSEMDPVGRQQFFNWLAGVKATTFIVSNEIDDLCEIADLIWVLQDGNLVAQGTPHQVFNHLSANWQLPAPTSLQLAQKMDWRLPTSDFPVNFQELREAIHATN